MKFKIHSVRFIEEREGSRRGRAQLSLWLLVYSRPFCNVLRDSCQSWSHRHGVGGDLPNAEVISNLAVSRGPTDAGSVETGAERSQRRWPAPHRPRVGGGHDWQLWNEQMCGLADIALASPGFFRQITFGCGRDRKRV